MERQQRTPGNPDEELSPPNPQMAVSGAIAIAALVILIIVALLIEPRAPGTGTRTGTDFPSPVTSSEPTLSPTPEPQ
jgi:hypothetical protein